MKGVPGPFTPGVVCVTTDAMPSEMLGHRKRLRVVEAASGHLDGVTLIEGKGQRSAAGGAEPVFGDVGACVERGLAGDPGQLGLFDHRQGREHVADRLLTHAAVANRTFGGGAEFVANRTTLASTGNWGHAIISSDQRLFLNGCLMWHTSWNIIRGRLVRLPTLPQRKVRLFRNDPNRLIIEPIPKQGLAALLESWAPMDDTFPEIEDLPSASRDIF